MLSSSNTEKRKPVIVLGLGNTLMRDEGVGIRIVQKLEASNSAAFPNVEFADYGTAGMRVLHGIANRRKAVIVDCARMGCPPGAIRRFTPENVRSIKRMPGFSLHEGDLLNVLSLSRQLGETPEEVVIFGIEPKEVSPGDTLSNTVKTNIEKYLDTIRDELKCTSSHSPKD